MCYLDGRRAIRDRDHGVDGTSGPPGQGVHRAIVGRDLQVLLGKSLVPVGKTVLLRRQR